MLVYPNTTVLHEVVDCDDVWAWKPKAFEPLLPDESNGTLKKIQHVLHLIQEVYYPHQVVIAGGAIRDLHLLPSPEQWIKDYDFFVLGVETTNPTALEEFNRTYTSKLWDIPSIEYGRSPTDDHYGNDKNRVVMSFDHPLLLGTSLPKFIGKGQIILTPKLTVEALLKDFDWLNCQFSYDGKFLLNPGLQYFYSHKLVLNDAVPIPRPLRTLSRGFYLERKYKDSGYEIPLPLETVHALVAMTYFQDEPEPER